MDFTLLQEQILLFLAVFGLLTLVVHALMRSASGRATLAVRSSEVAAAGVGHPGQPVEGDDVRPLGRDRRHRWRVARHVLVRVHRHHRAAVLPGLFWLALAVTFGIRRPGGALLAGFAFAGGTAVFHWISSWSFLSGGDVQALITSIYFVPILSGLGAIQLAQEPDGILALAGQQKLRKKREKARLARIAEAEAEVARRRGARARARRTPTSRQPRRQRTAWRGLLGAGRDARPRSRCAASSPATATSRCSTASTCASSAGKVTALLGANGAGKSTLCSVAAGIVDASLGTVYLEGTDITDDEPFRRARAGVLLVPEARGIFPGLTVEENLTVLLRDEQLAQGRLRALPDPPRAAQAGRRAALGWRAADAEPRARARRPARRAHRRRADARPRAARRRRR